MKNIICLIILSLFPLPAIYADTLTIKPDGSGDFLTIQSAINASINGDIILLTDGVFKGVDNRNLNTLGKSITIQSLSGISDSCIIDCEGTYGHTERRAFDLSSSEDSTTIIRNLSIINGSTIQGCPGCKGAAIRLDSAAPKLENIIFRDNYGSRSIIAVDYSIDLVIRNCKFINNKSYICPGIALRSSCYNTLIDKCLFANNTAEQNGHLIDLYLDTKVKGCTFVNNKLSNDSYSSIFACHGMIPNYNVYISNVIISNNIIQQVAWRYDSSYAIPDFKYCDIWNNNGHDWDGDIANQFGQNGNISENPLFVDTLNNNYHLLFGSPCIDAGDPNSPIDRDGTIADIGCFFYNQCMVVPSNNLNNQYCFSFFPNPAKNKIYIKVNDLDSKSIEIFNISGASLIRKNIETDAFSIDVSGLSQGIYIIKINSITKAYKKKLIIY